ncbi:MAG: RagB/SusD family nutrient uptake outer membrane protein [Bacteroidota bacterium]
MKKAAYTFLTISLLTFASSCVKLVEDPEAFLTTQQFYKTQADAIAAVNGVYYTLNGSGQTLYNSLFQIGIDIASDEANPGPRARNADVRAFAVLSHSTTNDRVSEIWRQLYAGIARTNIAIDKIPAIAMEEALKTRLINETKFIRALYYFNLVRLYGGVPLILHEPTSLGNEAVQVSRNSAEEVYQQIITDLKDAEGLPATYSSTDVGRVTGGAAKALLARVYLTKKDWNNAASKALEVINGPYGYDLFSNYADVFNKANNNGKEHIFSAQFKSNSNGHGNSLGSRGTPTGIPGIDGGDADIPTTLIYNQYRAGDTRKAATFFTSLVSPTTGTAYTFTPHYKKYYDPSVNPSTGESGVNFPIIRFADVLLEYAEAVNEASGPTTDAFAAFNRVRTRAGIPTLNSLSQSQFRDSIYQERRLEFVYEHQRWFDLVRTGTLIQNLHAVGKTNAQQKHYLYPIPQREIDLNPKLTQNPGW